MVSILVLFCFVLDINKCFSTVFSGVRVSRSLVYCVCFVDRYCPFVLFLLVLSCLFFFDLWILITWGKGQLLVF
jgi:hypothetical protein